MLPDFVYHVGCAGEDIADLPPWTTNALGNDVRNVIQNDIYQRIHSLSMSFPLEISTKNRIPKKLVGQVQFCL